jgi:hypothetical protein
VYGFITVSSDLIFDIIEHPFIQRLRRIKQLGLTDLVYPGAIHTRFHHALGAMCLMQSALNSLRSKGQEISDDEYEATSIAILLHDIGHGPFSHALEYVLLPGIGHEFMSEIIMAHLAKVFGSNVYLAHQIFTNQYPRKFFHQLVSSQLDIDRLDYLKRDCFYTGVSEGSIGADRIIKMLNVVDDQIVVEEKGIYSIENFLNARRLMYWQVYLHKTSVSAEKMLVSTITRVKELVQTGEKVFASPSLLYFLENNVSLADVKNKEELLEKYCLLDDYDIWGGLKFWSRHSDPILSSLSNWLLQRKLFKIIVSNQQIDDETIKLQQQATAHLLKTGIRDVHYFVKHGSITNAAYLSGGEKINILTKEGKVKDIAQASDLPNIKAMSKIVKKYYLCWPKNVNLRLTNFFTK